MEEGFMDQGICELGCKGLIGVHTTGEMGGKAFHGKGTAFAMVYMQESTKQILEQRLLMWLRHWSRS